jgi:hypothetical protein
MLASVLGQILTVRIKWELEYLWTYETASGSLAPITPATAIFAMIRDWIRVRDFMVICLKKRQGGNSRCGDKLRSKGTSQNEGQKWDDAGGEVSTVERGWIL